MANISQALKELSTQDPILRKISFRNDGKSRQSQMKENEEDLLQSSKLPLTNVYGRFLKQKGKERRRNLGTSGRKNRKSTNVGKYNRLSFP